MAYTDIDDPTAFFQTVTYTGNGATGRSITLPSDTDMQPDWVWLKSRGEAEHHQLTDSVRGVNKQLYSHLPYAQASETDRITAFNSDGFTIQDDIIVNKNTIEFVAWCWKAGTAFSNDASSTSVGSIDSAGSVNTDAGFSIITFTGNNTNDATIAHGLGTTPAMIITKNIDDSVNWRVWHKNLPNADDVLFLNGTNAAVATSAHANGYIKTVGSATYSTHASNSDANGVNGDDDAMIAYCFAGKQGFSKFGTYEGNGNDDGPFINTGFAPAFVMVKCFDQGEHWNIYDNKRGASSALSFNLNNAERTMDDSPAMELLSNGFKIRTSDGNLSNADDSFLYMAFAEEPFVTSTGVPATAK